MNVNADLCTGIIGYIAKRRRRMWFGSVFFSATYLIEYLNLSLSERQQNNKYDPTLKLAFRLAHVLNKRVDELFQTE
ncbi:hypothetical protein ABWW58_08215 [Sporolactobacillus sp. STCC-11]|uniref:hypothetical protein n=1 Tax=Sporolactobacillus caesalpiniae TaxID=3230362 RepID=UPI00339622A7